MSKIIYLKDRQKEYELDLSKYGDVRKPNPDNTFLDNMLYMTVIFGGSILIWALFAYIVIRKLL